MNKKTNLLIVDDHILFRKGLVQLISGIDQFHVSGEASNGEEALEMIKDIPVDVILLDLSMPVMDGMTTLRTLREQGNDIPTLILSISDDPIDVITAINLKANGYILKSEEFDVLCLSIQDVRNGGFALSKELLGFVFRAIRNKSTFPVELILSKRELEVLEYLYKGGKVEEIAKHLFVSENTIKTHLRHIYEKMNVNNRYDAVEKGLAWGIIK